MLEQKDLEMIAEVMRQTVTPIYEKLDELDQKIDQVDQRVDRVEQKVTKTQVIIENEISRKIDIIGEGHDFLKQRLSEALQMEQKRERMELELINLRLEIKKIKEHLNIA